MELLFVDYFFQELWLGKKIGNKDEACSVNIACRAFSFVFFFLTFAFLSTFQILSYLLKQFYSCTQR